MIWAFPSLISLSCRKYFLDCKIV